MPEEGPTEPGDQSSGDLAASGRQVLDTIADIGETFTRTLDLRAVLDRIIASLIALTQADDGSVMLVDSSGDHLVVAAAIGPRADTILGNRQSIDASLAGRAAREPGPIVVEARMEGVSAFPRDISRSLLQPLRVAGRLVGVLNLNSQSDPSRLGPETVRLLGLLANQAAIIVENARLYEELARKEQRLELFVDRMLRTQAAEQEAAGPSEAELEAVLGNVMRRTLSQFTEATHRLPSDPPSPFEAVTARESQVLSFLVEGRSNKQIAVELGIKEGTVKNHLLRLMTKLGAADRTQAAVIAIRSGLIS